MATSAEIYLSRAYKKEASETLEFIMSLSSGDLHDFYQFMQGARWGISRLQRYDSPKDTATPPDRLPSEQEGEISCAG